MLVIAHWQDISRMFLNLFLGILNFPQPASSKSNLVSDFRHFQKWILTAPRDSAAARESTCDYRSDSLVKTRQKLSNRIVLYGSGSQSGGQDPPAGGQRQRRAVARCLPKNKYILKVNLNFDIKLIIAHILVMFFLKLLLNNIIAVRLLFFCVILMPVFA